jgi:hypothetical protein
MTHETGEMGQGEPIERLRAELHAAQQRLAYYEKFGALVQEQLDTVVSRATEVRRETEAEQAQARVESEQLRSSVQRLQEETRALHAERDRLVNELDQLRQEAQRVAAENDRRRAEGAAVLRQAQGAAAEILADLQRKTDAQVAQALATLNAPPPDLAVPSEMNVGPTELALSDTPPSVEQGSASPTAAAEDEVYVGSGLNEAYARPSLAVTPPSEGVRSVEERDEDAGTVWLSPLDRPQAAAPSEQTSGFDVGSSAGSADPDSAPDSWPWPVAPASAPAEADIAATRTRLVVRPALGDDARLNLQQKLTEAPGVQSVEPGTSDGSASVLLVTHAFNTSLLGSLLAIPGLDFRLTGRGDDYLEVEVLGMGLGR